MNHTISTTALAVLGLVLGVPVAAQRIALDQAEHPLFTDHTPDEELAIAQGIQAPELGAVPSRATGLHRLDGELLGGGPDYLVSFTSRGPVFTPALGAAAAEVQSFAFQLESIRRGSALVHEALEGREAVEVGPGAEYRHAPGVVERYAILPEGIAQSFTLDGPLPGSGDLVVRGRITTNLPLAHSGPDGLVFSDPELGGVSYGSVTGVDAVGATAAGELRFDGEFLELVLPAKFVDNAALPLVVDPLIGSLILVSTGFDDSDSDVAYDAGQDLYLVVWERQFAAGVVQPRAQRVLSNGTLTGGVIFLENSGVHINPSVGNCNLSNRFLVAYQSADTIFGPWDIVGRSVTAVPGGLVSPRITLHTPGVGDNFDPDVSSQQSTSFEHVLVVWNRSGDGIKITAVTVPNVGNPDPGPTFSVSTNGLDSKPAIAKNGGASGRRLVVWERFFTTPAPGDTDVRGRVVNLVGVIQSVELSIATTASIDEAEPDTDGNGVRWVVAYQVQETTTSFEHDIHCANIDWSGLVPVVAGKEVLEADLSDDERNPAVAWVGGAKYFVAYADQGNNFDADIWMAGVNNTCEICEVKTVVSSGTANHRDLPELASQLSGASGAGDGALLTWSHFDLVPPFASVVRAHRLEGLGPGGAITNLGGGCGGGGTLKALGPSVVGSKDFVFSLAGADPLAIAAFFNISLAGDPTIACGPCVSDIFRIWFTVPLFGGGTVVPMPIPCDVNLAGAKLVTQMTVYLTTASPCPPFPNVSASNRVSWVIAP